MSRFFTALRLHGVMAAASLLGGIHCSVLVGDGSYAVVGDAENAGGPDAAVNSPTDSGVVPSRDALVEAPTEGAACSTCPMTLYRATQGKPFSAIAVDGINVYWTDGATLWSCAVSGCNGSPDVVIAGPGSDGGGAIAGLAADSTSVYWTDGADAGLVLKCPAAGCAGNAPTAIASAQNAPTGIAVDDSRVYWTTADAVKSCALGGCPTPTILATGSPFGAIALDATNVYWPDGQAAGLHGGTVLACAKGGCQQAPVSIATGLSLLPIGVETIAVASGDVYWSVLTDIEVCATPTAGIAGACGSGSIAPPLNGASSMTSDTTNLYAILGQDLIAEYARGNWKYLAQSSISVPLQIAVDTTSVYWTANQTTGSASINTVVRQRL